jgi:hypothetical protein
VLVSAALEAAAGVWTLALAYAFTGPCTAEYTPELEVGSPRWDFCHGPLGGVAAYGGLALIPLTAIYIVLTLPRPRRAIIVSIAVAFLASIAWPWVGLGIAHAISPT